MIRVLLADDHQVVRQGLRRLLEEDNGIRVVDEAGTVPELLEKLRTMPVDVLLLDIAMPGPGIVETLREVQAIRPGARALVLTAYPEAEYAVRVLRAGAAGYLTKDRSLDQLVEAIRRVYRGGMYVSPSLGEVLAARLGGAEPEPVHGVLSDREFQVLKGLAQGEPLKSIASRLTVSPKTVTTYRARILQKLGLGSNADLVRYALEHGLLTVR
ncbi:MAG TPA: response regulator transcription factor [Gemmatimonadales bacterium]|jgi:DNA-binding NarL/FixJ family response regulator|nr:response regulator transcription factor [Gemmatimonadales bacterium]